MNRSNRHIMITCPCGWYGYLHECNEFKELGQTPTGLDWVLKYKCPFCEEFIEEVYYE